MKNFLLKTCLLLVCLLCGAGTMWATDVTVTKTVNQLKEANNWTASSGSTINGTYRDFDLDNNINVKLEVGAAGNSGSIWGSTTYDWRLYQANSPIITISSKGSCVIKSVKFTYTSSNNGVINTKGCEKSVASNYQIKSGTAYDVNASSAIYYVGNTSTATNGQARITAIEVVYSSTSGGGSTPTALSVPTNLASSNVATTSATLSWDAVSNASSYTVKIGSTEYTNVTTTSYNATGLTAGTPYTWTVKAVGDGTNYSTSAYAANANFTTEAEQGGDSDGFTHDVLTHEDFKAEGTNYADFSNVSKNTAVYAGNSAFNNGISLRSNNSNSGIVSTKSGGKIKSVTVTWNSTTTSGRTLDVYGSNTAYRAATELYGNEKNGEKLGSIVMGTSTSFTVNGDYAFVGVRSNSGALIIDKIDFAWEENGESTDPDYTDKTVSSIVVKYRSNKYVYTEGEYFAPGGLTITATYSDNTTEDIHYSDHESAFTFSPALDEPLTVSNTTITITYGGVSTTQTITVEPLVDITNTQETAYTVAEAIALINAGKGLSTPVYVKGIVSKIVTEYSSSYGNISFNVSADGETTGDQFQFFHNFKGADKLKWTDEDTKPAVGDEVIGFGKLTKYSSTYEFAEGNYIVSLTHPAAKTKPELSFEPASCVATLGQPFTAPTLTNPEGVEVTYSSSAEDVATVDSETGAVTLVGAGTTTITATFTGNENYLEASARYTLVVEAATTPEPGDEVTFDFTTKTYGILVASNSNTNDYETTGKTISENGVSMEIACTKYRIWDGGSAKDLRFFSDGNPSWTITAPNGYTIIQIIHTGESVASISGNSGSISYTKPNNTWTGEAKSVTFTSSTNKANISTISVTLKESGTDPDVDPEPTTQYGELAFVATTGNDNYYATFSCDRDVIFDAENEAIEVQTVAVVDGSLLVEAVYNNSLSAVTDKTKDEGWITGYYVPANTGVLVYSIGNASAKYYYAEANQGNVREDVDADNMLVAACIPMAGDSKFYKLAYGDWTNKTKLGFWWGEENGAAFECKAGTAYLAVPNDDAAANSNMRGFSFEPDARPTGIESISNDVVAGEIYNLQGQRISRLQQGVNIVNGHKVIR